MKWLTPDWPHAPRNVRALSTLRDGGVSAEPYDDGVGGGGLNLGLHVGDHAQHVMQNRQRLRTLLPAEPIWLEQVHGVQVIDAANKQHLPQADASIASASGVVCAIMTADCLPVLFCDRRGSVVGVAHAGWRGLAQGVLEATLAAMRNAGADEISAWLGPAIGPQAFEVGAEVIDALTADDNDARSTFVPAAMPGKYMADIYTLARRRLRAHGVEQISGGDWCTVTDHRFYSYRREGRTGRMASLIWLE